MSTMTSPRSSSERRPRAGVPATELSPSRLRFAVARLARLLRQQDETGYGPTVTAALATVEAFGPLTLGEIAGREQVAPPTITKIVERLVANGLVTREPDPNDRRASLVRITSEGAALLADARTKRNEWLGSRLAALDADEIGRLAAAMDVLEKIVAVPDAAARPGRTS